MFHKYRSIEQFAKVAPYLTTHNVVVQEKVDGTNISMHFHDGICDLWGRTIPIDREKPGMYKPFVDWFTRNEVTMLEVFNKSFVNREGIFCGELINTNKLRYRDVPPIILFDYTWYTENVEDSVPLYDRSAEVYELVLATWGKSFGATVIPTLYCGPFKDMPPIDQLITVSAFDDKVIMEGVVVKAFNVDIPYEDDEGNPKLSHQKRLYGKYVRPEFKEVKTESIKYDPVAGFAKNYGTEARLDKAIQKAREQGIDYEKNRGALIKLAIDDIEAEENKDLDKQILDVFGKMVRKAIGTHIMSIYNERITNV